MRLPTEERTSRAIIRREALRVFAERGPAAATIRDIAAAAGVSPALVIRHYGSKEQLRSLLDDDVVEAIDAILATIVAASTSPDGASVDHGAGHGADVGVETGIGASLATHLPSDSPIPAYLTRMLIDGGTAGAELFARLFETSQGALSALVGTGAASPGADPRIRAMVLLVSDLATIMLRDRITTMLGVDPLSADGAAAWGREILAIHRGGLTHE